MHGPLYGVPMKKSALLIPILMFLAACTSTATAPEPQASPAPQPQSQESKYDKLVEVARKLAGMGQPEKAAKYANQATELDANKGGAWAVLGLLAAQQMDLDGAVKLYQKAIDLGTDESGPYAELASLYDVSKDYPKAIATYKAWLAKTPSDHEMRHQMALSLLIQGKTQAAIAQLETIVKAAPTSKIYRTDLGYAHLKSGQLDKAVLEFEAAQPEGSAPSMDYGLVVAVVQKMTDPSKALAFVQRFAAPGKAKDKLVSHLQTLVK